MKTLLFWLVPPFIGAIIGYVTNAVAIKMLFRPLKAVRVFGIRLPFTPGILPRQRHQLAESIGRMVERELLAPDIVRQRLSRPDVRQSVKDGIAGFTGKLLAAPVGGLRLFGKEGAVGEEEAALGGKEGAVGGEEAALGGKAGDGVEAVAGYAATGDAGRAAEGGASDGGILKEIAGGFVESPVFRQLFDDIFSELMALGEEQIFDKSLRDLLGDERVRKMRQGLEAEAAAYLRGQSGRIAGQASVILYGSYAKIADSCIGFLNQAKTRAELEAQGRVFLSSALKKLNTVQRFFLSAGNYDTTLSEKMPEIIDDLIRQLNMLFAKADTQRSLVSFVAESIDALLAEDETDRKIAQAILDLVESYADKPVGKAVAGLNVDEIKLKLFDFVKNGLSGMGKPGGFLSKLLEKHGNLTPIEIFAITAEKKDALDGLIALKLLSLADEQIGNVLKSINVQALVSERIDDLDMIQVEHIILDIMANQLKWINVFGAILGAIIGVSQSHFSLLIR
jgi:uncharacterized membrane protein YheB (UPF0754 family)